ncbi:ABC transporter ATP-binding protein [Allorhizobium sp. BGMRC 0089]|uniref:ABC transporter ATP-binding protein n=1 Tax=Allorhizobium sonneratiae TaxID=2934936 RepID=UPI0020348919|nr:ABC transporter ATP-binding protein [Allorhizobium sonneratiae]MCM2290940.1 ABC transporter ATP-binding protein [Allorhizobium sonneratiae]
MSIVAEDLVWSAGKSVIVDHVSMRVSPGRIVGLLGPNGSGKSSLLRLLCGLRRPDSGRVLLDGVDMAGMSRRAIARRLALVEQQAATEARLSVADVVRLGRTPHRSPMSGWTHEDDRCVRDAIDKVGMAHKAKQDWQSLSGGERQRAHIARALAQAPKEILLDEPTNHLDIQHQIELMRLIRSLSLTTVIALHDLNHAAMFCDELMVMQKGRIVATGAPENVLTEDLLRDVFKVEARLETSPYHGRPHIHFLV